MKKVLHILNSVNYGGAETFILNVYKNIDLSEYQFDFLLRSTNNGSKLLDEITQRGGNVFIAPNFPKKVIHNYFYTRRIINNGDYDVIHLHANSLVYIIPLLIKGKNFKAKYIIHSHSSKSTNILVRLIHYFNRWICNCNKNIINLACSIPAGKWMFGESDFTVVSNGIELDKYQFNQSKRNDFRNELKIDEKCFVIGHVGRFVKVKNHKFLVDVFEKIYIKNSNARLLLIGEGQLEEEIKNYVESKGLSSAVIFIKNTTDINYLYSAMDCFVLPSLFEGLSLVTVEAQMSGLPCIVSDQIPPEVFLTDKIESIPITNEFINDWVKAINGTMDKTNDRMSDNEQLKKFDIKHTVNQLEKIYGQ